MHLIQHKTMFLVLVVSTTLTASEVVSSVPRARVQQISRQIDQLVEQQLAKHNQKPNVIADDETFLRRIYLDIAGRIPTLTEAKSFLSSNDKDKRAVLIDSLLASPAYTSHAFNYWADVLRIKNRLQGGNPGLPYIEYVKDSLESNTPFDVFVRGLLASEGSILERGNGATGYYLRDEGMPEDNMSNTVRVFLGTRLECAQCHDHPFDDWTQKQFYEMVAFTGGMQTRISPMGSMGASMEFRNKIRKSDADAKVKQAVQRIVRPLSYGVSGDGTGLARLPDSYQYDDGKPNEIVTAKTMFEHKELVHAEIPAEPRRKRNQNRNKGRNANRIPGAEDIGSRTAFADWLTSPENPRFTLVIANRLWKRAMGLGLIDPVDDLSNDTEASNDELLEYLTRQMTELDYDMKQYLRAIYNSDTYQREASASDVTDYLTYNFPGPLLRRMSGEQLWDSFLTLAVPDLDTKENPRNQLARSVIPGATDIYDGFDKVKDMSMSEIMELAEQQVTLMENPEERRKQFREKMMQANGNQAGNKYTEEARQLRQRMAKLRRLQQQAKKNRNPLAMRNLQEQMREIQTTLRHLPTRTGGDMVRASELPAPAPPGHFVREFGQSDRDQIENAHSEPAISQVLSLMNGTIEQRIISNPRTVLMRNLVAADSPSAKINTVYLSMLSRYPTAGEQQLWLNAASQGGADTANDLIWTLANTSEFMFVR